ncbi:MAG TPA: SCP2 sterol-binding domain-containing protein [Acidimicrobiales bacterium]|nr:SCP2 sterol-binding domain-containing protein [Acidimicrobiales bacterium]
MRYLSPAWIDAAGAAVAGDGPLGAALAGITLTVEQVVTGGPDGDVTWSLGVDDGKVALIPGPAARSDLRLTTDYATAAAVAAGELGAQRAFVEGRLRVGGDLSLLITHQRALAAVDDALAGVRARTTYR